MKILLINPDFKYKGGDLFPLGLGYIARIVKEKGHDISVLDFNACEISDSQLSDFLLSKKPDLVFITSTTPSFEDAARKMKIVKTFSDAKIIFGGTHATFKPEDCLEQGANIIIRGEGELTIAEVLDCLENEKTINDIDGISFFDNCKVIHNRERDLIENLDTIKFPLRTIFPLEKYKIMSIITSRGCSYSCSYCSASCFWKRIARFRSPENVIEELKEIISLGFDKIKFHDSTFTLDRSRTMKICDLIIKNNLKIKWSCETRAEHLDFELLKQMKKSGCVFICFGVDSGSPDILSSAKRNINLNKTIEIFRLTSELDIKRRAYIMFGLPNETRKTVKETIEFLKKIKPDEIMLSLATAYPGTELYNRKKIKLDKTWVAKFSGHGRGSELFLPDTLTVKEYVKLADEMYKEIKSLN